MATFNTVITRTFDLFFAPFTSTPGLGIVVISLITGLVLVLAFRYTSNQRGIRAVKRDIVADLLEIFLYRDELRVVLRAQARLFRNNLRYLGYALVPLACMILPVVILLVQIDSRYGHRPLRVGERAIVAVNLRPGAASPDQVLLSAPAGIEIETPALRMPGAAEVDWRVRAVAPGNHQLRITIMGRELTKQIVVGQYGRRISTQRVGDGVWQQFLRPGEPPLPDDGPLSGVKVSYPNVSLHIFRWRLHWIWPWLILSMAFGYALKGLLQIQV